MLSQVKPRDLSGETPALSKLPLVYFLLTIGLFGLVVGYFVCVPLWALGLVFRRIRGWGGHVLARGISLMMKVQPWLDLRGNFHLPDRTHQNFITISNHRSHLDMFLLLARIPNIRVIAKANLFRVPFLASYMRWMRTIPISQGDVESYWSAMNCALEGTRKGDSIHIFPEMTRCEPGAEATNDFHLAPFRVAMQAGVPVVPIVFIDTDRVWPKYHSALSFRSPAQIRTLDALNPQEFPDAEALRDEARRRINQSLCEK